MLLRGRFGLNEWSMIAADKSHPIPPDPYINGDAFREHLPPTAWAVHAMIVVLIVVAAFAGAEVDRSLGRMVRITNGIGEATVQPMGTGAPTLRGLHDGTARRRRVSRRSSSAPTATGPASTTAPRARRPGTDFVQLDVVST